MTNQTTIGLQTFVQTQMNLVFHPDRLPSQFAAVKNVKINNQTAFLAGSLASSLVNPEAAGLKIADLLADASKIARVAKMFEGIKDVERITGLLKSIGFDDKIAKVAADAILKNPNTPKVVENALATQKAFTQAGKVYDAQKFAQGVTSLNDLPPIYRGGTDMVATLTEGPNKVKIFDGKITSGLSINVNSSNASVASKGATKVIRIPDGLAIKQVGTDIGHFEIVSSRTMTLEEYNKLVKLMIN